MDYQQREQLIKHSLLRVIKSRCPGRVDKALAGQSYGWDCRLKQVTEQLDGLGGDQSLSSAHIEESVEHSTHPPLIQRETTCQRQRKQQHYN